MIVSKEALYKTAAIRACEQRAITDGGLNQDELMFLAGSSAFSVLTKLYPTIRKIMVFCGSGNNAGDGYVLARLAQEQGFSVVINQYKPPSELPTSAQRAAIAAIKAGVFCQEIDGEIREEIELIVDALLGIGLKDKVRDPIASAIDQINQSGLPVLALDTPSGLNVDTGCMMGHCVRATVTVTFIAPKLGMAIMDGPDYVGEVFCQSLKLESYLETPPDVYRFNYPTSPLLPRRAKNTHKGNFGHVLIVGGSLGMPGSVCLAATAALRVGAGTVTVAMHPEYAHQPIPSLPEAMIYGIHEGEELLPLLERADVCVIGPGLGLSQWAMDLWHQVMASNCFLVVDASALRILARHPHSKPDWVLTPHPGEAADLIHCSVNEIQVDRARALTLLNQQYGGNIVLKGAGSMVYTEEQRYLCNRGNPGMASAGMGDVLSGVIAGLIAQGLSPSIASLMGVWVHASAGDAAAEVLGERGLLASDLMPYLRRQMNKEA